MIRFRYKKRYLEKVNELTDLLEKYDLLLANYSSVVTEYEKLVKASVVIAEEFVKSADANLALLASYIKLQDDYEVATDANTRLVQELSNLSTSL